MQGDAVTTERVLGGRYRLGPVLGRGGMAEVYDGHDDRLDRAVAVKLLRPDMAARPEVRNRFETEARSAARLTHPNVVSVFDTGEEAGDPYLVMERLPGETLADRFRAGPIDPAWVQRMAGDVLAGLGAAHDAGILHRDIKPANILLASDGCAKVADFGIAKSVEVSGDHTTTGLLLGTPAYLAPERVEGTPATPASDLYSVGVVLYEALTGTRPFTGDSAVAMAYAVQHTTPPPLGTLCPDLPPAVARTIDDAMAKDPALRPASAQEMASRLGVGAESPWMGRAVAEGDDTMLLAGGPVAGVVPWWRTSRARAAALAAAALILVLMVGAAVAATRRATGPSHPAGTSSATTTASTAATTVSTRPAGDSALAADLEALAARVGDAGEQGPALASGLSDLAVAVRRGDTGTAAAGTQLLADASAWNQAGEDILKNDAYQKTVALVGRIPAVTVPSTTTRPVRHKGGDHGKGSGD